MYQLFACNVATVSATENHANCEIVWQTGCFLNRSIVW
jgi:hypothetical protein